MQNYPTLEKLELQGKKVVMAVDLDVDIKDDQVVDDTRLKNILPTANYLFEHGASRIVLLGKRGRPENHDPNLSTEKLIPYFKNSFSEVFFMQDFEVAIADNAKLVIFENLRYWPEEDANDPEFAKKLASLGEVYVNDAFAVSHRNKASIVGIPKILPSALGLHIVKEIENLSKVFDSPAGEAKHPVIVLISGAKKDKLDYLEGFKNLADKVLVAGRLPEFLGDDYKDEKVVVARLLPDKEDITIHSVEAFEAAIRLAKTIIFAGPIGLYEDGMHTQGTKRILEAISQNNKAFRIAGGGDTLAAIKTFGFESAFDWISSGGGASLEFLVNKTLPGLNALLN